MPDGGISILVGFVFGWVIAPVVLIGMAAARSLLEPIWPRKIIMADYSKWPLESHPRYNARLGRLID